MQTDGPVAEIDQPKIGDLTAGEIDHRDRVVVDLLVNKDFSPGGVQR